MKSEYGAFSEEVDLVGMITDKSATDTTIWNPTNINGATRTALARALEFRDLLRQAKTAWWKEAAAGNWYDDGNPARAKGLLRLRLGEITDGSTPFYLYGFVKNIEFSPPSPGSKDAGALIWKLRFAFADVISTAG